VTIFLVVSMFFFGCGVGALVQRLADKRQNTKVGTPSASHNNKRDVIRYEENHPCSFCDNFSVCKLKVNPIPCFRRSELTPVL
jgi:thioredoxin-related protein